MINGMHVRRVAVAGLMLISGPTVSVALSPAAAQAVSSSAYTDPLPAGGALVDPAIVSPHAVAAAATMPTAVDLSAWTVPVGDQGSAGSCVTWAINYAMMGWYSRYQRLNTSGTAFAPMYVYSQIHADNTSDGGGSYPSDAYNVATSQGVVDTQGDYYQGNYDWIDQPTAAEKINAAHYKTGTFSYLWSSTAPGTAGIGLVESKIANHQPVAITIPVYSAFDNLSATNFHLDSSQVDPSTFRGYHEVLVVGYDAAGVRIQNSWGAGWGDHGFGDLNWDFVTDYALEATSMTGFVQPQPTVPSVPTSVSGTQTAATSATVTWSPPASSGSSAITGYKVSRDGTDSAGVGAYTTTVPASTRSSTMTRLVAGSSYNLSVQAVNASGAGTAARVAVGMSVSPIPAKPTSFVLSQSGAGTATMTWQPPVSSGGQQITGYLVSRNGKDTAGYGAYSNVVPAITRTFTMTKLISGATYTLGVQAINASAVGPASSGTVVVKPYATAPTSFAVRQTSPSAATMTWQPPASTGGATITGYRVARNGKDSAGLGAYATTVAATTRSFTMTKLVANTTYILSVQAVTVNGAGVAASSKVLITTQPTAPTAVKATQTAPAAATITWQPPLSSGGQTITGYRVARNGVDSAGVGAYSTVVSTATRTFTMTRLVTGQTYTLSVQAVTTAGTGPAGSGSVPIN